MGKLLEGFLRGFGVVGGDIAQKEAEAQLEADAYVSKYQRQKQIDIQAERDLDEIKAKRQQQALKQAWEMYSGGMSASGMTQTDGLFGSTPATELSDEPLVETSSIPSTTPVSGTPFSAPTPVPQAPTSAPRTGFSDFVAEWAGLSEEMKSPENAAYALAVVQQRLKEKGTKLDIDTREIETKEKRLAWEMGKEEQDRSPWFEQNKNSIMFDLESKGLPASEKFVATSAKNMPRKAYEDAIAEQMKAYNSPTYVESATKAEEAIAQIETTLNLVRQADTGPISGSQIAVLIEQFSGGDNLASLRASIAPLIAAVPRTPGAISNYEAEGLEKALARLGNSKEANEQIMMEILNRASALREALRFEQSMASAMPLDKGQMRKAWSAYSRANEVFVRDKSGNLVENKARVSVEDWDWDTNKPKMGVVESKVDETLNKTFEVTPEEDKLLEMFKN